MKPVSHQKLLWSSLSLLALGLPLALSAQTTTTPAESGDDSPDPEQVFELASFEVNTGGDVGYVAVDSLAGGRINTPLKLTPSSVSALTSTFIEDLGIQDVRGALKWAPNVVAADPNAGRGQGGAAFQDWSFNYRSAGPGQQGGPGPTRNYFSFYQNPDSYNIDRIEFLRGPNSLVFGLGTVGGTLAVYTKRPRLDDTFATTTATLDSNGGARFELDANQVATDTVAVRLNAVADDFKGWQENDNGEFRAATLAVLYRPSPQTSVTFEAEYADKERTLFGTNIIDKVSGWDGETASETWGAAPTGPGADNTQPIQNAGGWGDWLTKYPVLIPGLGEDAQLQEWAGGYASNTSLPNNTPLNYQPRAGFYPDEIRLGADGELFSTAGIPVLPDDDWTYGSGVSDTEYKDFTLTVNHKFNENFEATASAYRYEDNQSAQAYESTGGAAIDINRELPNGQPNPNFGQAYADFFLSQQTQSRTVSEARVQINYNLDYRLFDMPAHQLFSASTSYKKLEISARQYLGQTVDPSTLDNPADWVQNMVWGRLYLDQPNQQLELPESVIWAPKADGYWFDFDDTFKLKDFAVLSHSRFFDDSLSILAGMRVDSYDEHIEELRRGQNLSTAITDESDTHTTYSLGGIYYFHWLGVFANYSQNIQPPNPGSQPLLNGERPGPEEGSGVDYGIRISTDDNKYYVTLTRYDTKSEGHLVENPVGLRGIWERYYDANPQLERDTARTGLAYSDTTDRDIEGWEFEVTANPTENIRLQASYAKPTSEVVNYYPDSRSYFDQYIDTWEAGVDTADTQDDADALRNQIETVRDKLAQSVPGTTVAGSVKYTASFFGTYSFLEDSVLDGLSIGAGISKTGRRYANVYDGEEYWGSDITTTNLLLAYEMEIHNLPVRFALNVDNVFDDNDPIITDYHYAYQDADGRHVPNSWYIQSPRTFRFTAKVTF